jgi:triphosphoribosyl-dephospho-CoA synthase
MALAAGHDLVAREYATGFATTFDVGAPAIAAARRDGLGWPEAAVEGFLTLLAAHPDTLIVRKLGATVATAISGRAQDVLGSGGVRTPEGRRALERFDEELRDERNARNPGTTADLTAAAIFVVLLDERGR